MDAIYGFSWSNSLLEERRCECDSTVDRNLKEFLEYWLRYHLPVQDIIQAWDLLPAFLPEPIAAAAAVQPGIPGTAQQPRQESQQPQQPKKGETKRTGQRKREPDLRIHSQGSSCTSGDSRYSSATTTGASDGFSAAQEEETTRSCSSANNAMVSQFKAKTNWAATSPGLGAAPAA